MALQTAAVAHTRFVVAVGALDSNSSEEHLKSVQEALSWTYSSESIELHYGSSQLSQQLGVFRLLSTAYSHSTMPDLESGGAIKQGAKADGLEDYIPVRVKELEDSLGSVRGQVKARRGLRERGGNSDDECSCRQHGDGEKGRHPAK